MRIIYSLAKFAVFQSFCITHGKLTAQSGVGAVKSGVGAVNFPFVTQND